MSKISLVFCGSFQQYSSYVLEGLLADSRLEVKAVVTTPATTEPNPVEKLARAQGLPVLTPSEVNQETLQELETLTGGKPDLLVTAGYGHLLPESWLTWPTMAALNLHFSLLPKYRGANPAEWAILAGEKTTGITLIEMSPSFDTGKLVAQAEIAITHDDTRKTVYKKLYKLGEQILAEMLTNYVAFRTASQIAKANEQITYFLPPVVQKESPTPYAKRLTREDGFIAWEAITSAMKGKDSSSGLAETQLRKLLDWRHEDISPLFIERASRALAGFPSLWTNPETTKGRLRMKILAAHVENQRLILDQVQFAGKNPSRWVESKNILKNEV